MPSGMLLSPRLAVTTIFSPYRKDLFPLLYTQVALTRRGIKEVFMEGGGPSSQSTGAYVVEGERSPRGSRIKASSLDELFAANFNEGYDILLKLDLEGHELAALEGGVLLLRGVGVIVCEVSFYDLNSSGRPIFHDIESMFAERGFILFDFASLSGRSSDGRLRTGDAVFVRRNGPLDENRGLR